MPTSLPSLSTGRRRMASCFMICSATPIPVSGSTVSTVLLIQFLTRALIMGLLLPVFRRRLPPPDGLAG